MNYNEFAESIKTKYPQYKDMDNKDLAERMIAKYPQYKDITFDTPAEEKKGIDLTPRGIGQTVGNALSAPIVAMRDNIPVKQAFAEGQQRIDEFNNEHKLGNAVSDFALYAAKNPPVFVRERSVFIIFSSKGLNALKTLISKLSAGTFSASLFQTVTFFNPKIAAQFSKKAQRFAIRSTRKKLN
jgi:hypothetical protein